MCIEQNVNMRILNGYLVIRVGGGYMKFDEWYDKYGKKEGLKVNKEALKDASASGTSLFLNPHHTHTHTHHLVIKKLT